MGKPFQLVDTTFSEKALDATSLRQQVISDNMANANNPEYQAKAVKFDEHLREAFDHDVTETRTTLEREFRKTGIDVIEISTDRPYADRLMRFFRQRAKRFR